MSPLVKLSIVAASLLAGQAHAELVDLRGAGGTGGYGNSLEFNSGGVGLTVTGYAETGASAGGSYFYFQNAQVYSWATGIGVCNRDEGLGSSCTTTSEHEVDTVGRDDLLVMVFDQTVRFDTLTVDPYDGGPNDRDITFWVGNLASVPDLTTFTFSTLADISGMSDPVLRSASSGNQPATHLLGGTGNVLLLSGDYLNRSCTDSNISNNKECEAYKIASISVTPVPLPAGLWLLGSGLLGLGALRRKALRA
jgi:hypothetical protein